MKDFEIKSLIKEPSWENIELPQDTLEEAEWIIAYKLHLAAPGAKDRARKLCIAAGFDNPDETGFPAPPPWTHFLYEARVQMGFVDDITYGYDFEVGSIYRTGGKGMRNNYDNYAQLTALAREEKMREIYGVDTVWHHLPRE